MLYGVRPFFKDTLIRYSALAAVIFIAAQATVLSFGIKPSVAPIFLHYTTYLGVDFVGAWYLAYLIPITSFVFVILNSILAYLLSRKDILFGYFLMVASALLSALFLIHAILTVRLNA